MSDSSFSPPADARAPTPPPATVAEVEATPMRTLVHHGESVEHDLRMEDLHRFFGERQIEFAGLVRDGRVTGICARSQLGFLLGSRFGFALNARSPAHHAGVKRPLVLEENTPLRQVLQAALNRHDDEFYEDVALVDQESRLIGLIPVEALVRLQSRLVSAQMEEMRRQRDVLQTQKTELFEAGHAVRQAQALSAGLFASNAVGVGLLDPAGRLEVSNGRLGELLALDSPPPAALAVDTLVVEPERPAWCELLLELQGGKQPVRARDFDLEIPGRGRRNMRFSLGWIAETSQICICVDDITQQREIERHLQREEKQKLLDTLVGGVAHELNNKLTPVLGYAELLAQNTTGAQATYVGHIRKSVQESAKIIRQLLRLSRPEEASIEALDLRDVINEAALMLQFQAREHRVRFLVEAGPVALPVRADSAQLKQVVMNLALNSLHAMEAAAQPVLHIGAGRDVTGIYFTVRDNGSGIPVGVIGRIFDPFFTTKGPDKGTGLGLSICHSIVRQHGGEIKVWSKPGEGTCFTVRLPAMLDLPADARGDSHTPFRLGLASPTSQRRVLVVEDQPVIRNFLKEAVRHLYGCHVDEAANGREGLALLDRRDYDLIISDIRMPEMTGPEFYLRLKDRRPEQAGKVVFVTGYMGQDQLQEDIARWGVPVLAKPFTIDRLARMCAARMNNKIAGVA